MAPFEFLFLQTAAGSFCRLHITVTQGSSPKEPQPKPSIARLMRNGWYPQERCPEAQASASNCTRAQYHRTPQATTSCSNVLSPAPAGAVHPEHHTCSQRPASLQVGPAPQTRLSDHHSCLAQASGAGQPSCGAVVEF